MVRSDCYLTFQKPVALLSPFACPESQVNREYVNRSQLQRLISDLFELCRICTNHNTNAIAKELCH